MNYRRERYHKNIKNKGVFLSIFSLFLVLLISIFISSNLSKIIYKNTLHVRTNEEKINFKNNENKVELIKEELVPVEKISESNIVMFQGGVFTDLDNAEEFKDKISDKTLATIINDGKHEKIFLGVSDSNNFSEMAEIFKKNNIQFVKQVYKIPNDLDYGKEIIEIIGKFSRFIIDNHEKLNDDEINISNLKNEIKTFSFGYGSSGLHKEFSEIKELILDFEDSVNTSELESVVDVIYNSLQKYKL